MFCFILSHTCDRPNCVRCSIEEEYTGYCFWQ